MTNEELWELFPIVLMPYNPTYQILFDIEKEILLKSLGESVIFRISHIGSTAISGIISKPTIDILLEINEHADLKNLVKNLERAGYIFSAQPHSPAPNMMFLKGYTEEGYKGQSYHVHIRYPGDWDEPVFRDYLNTHQDAAAKYEALKLKLQKKHKYNRDAYTEAKTSFVKKIVKLAREEK